MAQTIKLYVDWTLSDWLSHLENRTVDARKQGLARIKQVAAKLNLLTPNATVILVAGTNGKGTTVAALESIYHMAGYRVGTYTSPHLLFFNERIKVNGKCISDAALCQAFCCIEEARKTIELSYFEMATLAALLYFQISRVDLVILEVGLGGRLDASNILNPDLAIITTIDFDHQALLGNTLDSIGFEKAGILRAGMPLIYADKKPPQSIVLSALALGCPSYINGIHYYYEATEDAFIFRAPNVTQKFIKSPWHLNALAAAVMATICLEEKLPVKDIARTQGLQSIVLNGRQQRISSEIDTLLDVSHNAQSVAYLADTLRRKHPNKRIHAVFSAFSDKDCDALIQPMLGLVENWYPVLLTGKRARSAAQLHAIVQKYGIIIGECHDSAFDAYQVACQQASSGDLIVVYGSFLIVSGVLTALVKTGPRSNMELLA